MKLELSPIYQVLLLIFVTFGVYYPTLFAPLNYLDDRIFVNNLLSQEGFTLARHFAPGGLNDYYRPLLTLTFEIDKHVGGLQETFMHLVNILVHVFNVILVWMLARRFGEFIGRPSQVLPLLAACLFALHPINAEAVNWIAGRTDLLTGTFVFISLYALIEALNRPSLTWGVASAVALLGGALCKETALFLVPGAFFLLVCGIGPKRLHWSFRWGVALMHGMAAVSYFVMRWGAFHVDRGLMNTSKLAAQMVGVSAQSDAVQATSAVSFPWLEAVLTVLKVSGFYAVKLFQPLPLNFAIYRIEPFYLFPGIALLVFLAIFVWRRQPLGWIFLVSASIAVSALFVVFTKLAWTPVAERYMYVPSGPFVVGLTYMIAGHLETVKWRRAVLVMIPLLLVGAGWATVSRNVVWQDNLSLYEDTVRKSPDFPPARNQLALALIDHGQKEKAFDILASNPMAVGDEAALNKAVAKAEKGDYLTARTELLELLRSPGYLESEILERLVKITSDQANKIDDEHLKLIYYNDVLKWLERIRAGWPSGFNYYRIGRVHLVLQNRVEAQLAFAEAASRLPDNSLYKQPATKLARDLGK